MRSANHSEYNNFGIAAVAIGSTVREHGPLSLAKAALVMPFVMNKDSVALLAGKANPRIISALVSWRPELFLNFPRRFESALPVTFNGIQYLIQLGIVRYESGHLMLNNTFEVTAAFGERARRIDRAAKNLAGVLHSPVEELYLNLRIAL